MCLCFFQNSFNGFALWLPDLYSRLAVYSEAHPNHTLTICDVVSALSDSSAAPDTFIRSSDIDIERLTEINNLTYPELLTINNTITVPISPVQSSAEDAARYDVAVDIQNITSLVDMVAATNGTWLHNDTSTPTCSAMVNEAAFRNSLAIGVVCAIVHTSSGYLVDCIDRKKLMSKL
jgi:hypothetical protein